MNTAKEAMSGQGGRWQRYVRTVAMLCLGMSLLVGCSAGGNDSGSDTNGPAGNSTAGTATLLPTVKVINSTQADYVAAQTATTWTLRTASSVQPGDMLLLEDAAVKVLSVDTSSGQMILTVAPAEIQDVFSKLSLQLTFDQNSAEFLPDPNSDIQATFAPSVLGNNIAAPIIGSVNKVLSFPYKAPPFSANLSFTFLGDTNLDYDSSSSAGLTGALRLTGIVEGNTSMTTNRAIEQPLILAEKSIGILRIPVPISVTDAILHRIGIYTASIYVPISVGAEVRSASIAGGVNINGTVQSTVVTTYNATNGFVVTEPQNTGSLTVTGIASSDIPGSVIHGSLMVGPFIKASPQLLILNKVASIGADIKAALYAHGQVGSFLNRPYYCFDIQGMGQGTASGFFKTIAGTKLETAPISKSQDVGPRFVSPPDTGCSPAVQFSTAGYSATTTARSATITVTRTGAPSAPTTVQYATSNDTAVAGRDYTAVSGTLTFNPTETTKVFTIPILSAPTSQGGTVTLTLSQPSTGTELGTPNTAVLTIPPRKSVQFSSATYSVNATRGLATIAVTRTGEDLSEVATVQYATSNGTAVAGRDYTAVSGTLTFAQFDGAQSFDIPIPTTSKGGTVTLTLSQPSAGTRLGTPSTAVVTIAEGLTGTWQGSFSNVIKAIAAECTYSQLGTLTMDIVQNGTTFSGTYSRNWMETSVGQGCGLEATYPDSLSGDASGALTTVGDLTTLTGKFKTSSDIACGPDGCNETWTATHQIGQGTQDTIAGSWLGPYNLTSSSFTLTRQ
jgi:Calx-beta domain